jgi:hypothetical protein
VWLILQNIDSELARYLQRIGSLMAKGKRLKKPLCDALQHAVKANIKGAWALLSEVSRYCKQHIDVDLIVECWDTIKHSESGTPFPTSNESDFQGQIATHGLAHNPRSR